MPTLLKGMQEHKCLIYPETGQSHKPRLLIPIGARQKSIQKQLGHLSFQRIVHLVLLLEVQSQ